MPVRFHKAGYIKDDDARSWDADEMLQSIPETGTEEQNKEREKAGEPGMEIVGWSEKPRYDASHATPGVGDDVARARRQA